MNSTLCAVLLAGIPVFLSGCRGHGAAAPDRGLFHDVAARAGLRFRFSNGAHGRHSFLETTGSGCAFLDYDGDGLLDVLLLQAGPLPSERTPAREPRNRLYHNEGNGTFRDVTTGSGLEDCGYAQGVAVADVDGDGLDDIFITGFGGNHLFRNAGGTGRFEDITRRAGLADTEHGPRWCTSAAFGDYDGDGRLDLYVCRYIRGNPEDHPACSNPLGAPSYCSPDAYPADEHALYHNEGHGRFADVSRRAGIAGHFGRGLGVAWIDADRDGREDLFVANDLNPFFLWRNNGDGTFTDVAQEAGVAYGLSGQPLSGMGIGVRDVDGDGLDDLFVTVFSGQTSPLFQGVGKGLFVDRSSALGLSSINHSRLGFGCEFLDYDRDGWPDLLIGNGHLNEDIATYAPDQSFAEPKTLLHNGGGGSFAEQKQGVGDLAVAHVTRGLAIGDFDRDGQVDVLTNNQDGPPELLRSTGPAGGHWIAVSTRGVRSNPNGYHARITVRAGGRVQSAEVRSGSSYCSHSDARVYFGLGGASRVDALEIVWHGSHRVTSAQNLAADHFYRVREGEPPVLENLPAGRTSP